jgi:hypothetical protein
MELVCHTLIMLELNCDIPLGSFLNLWWIFAMWWQNVFVKVFNFFSVNMKKLLYTWKKLPNFRNHIIEKKKKPIDYSESINNFEYHFKLTTHCKLECFKMFGATSKHPWSNYKPTCSYGFKTWCMSKVHDPFGNVNFWWICRNLFWYYFWQIST